MKISLSWVLDHLDHDVKNLKSFAKDFQEKFNSSIGEMESFEYKVLSKDIFRDNFEGKDAWLIDDNGIRLATYKDIGGEKEGILPAPYTDEKIFKAGEFSDIIFDIDNKSLTHRADLWSHYGIAREISAFYGWKLKDINILDIKQSTDNSTGSVKAIVDSKVKAACKKFAVCEVDNIEITPSPFWLLIRLARVGSRSINLTVDLTNYVVDGSNGALSISYEISNIKLDDETISNVSEFVYLENGSILRILFKKKGNCTLTVRQDRTIIKIKLQWS